MTVVVIGGGGGEGAKAKGFAGSVGGSAGGTSQFKLGTNILLQATGGGGGVGRMLEYDTPTDNSSGGSGGSPNGVAGSVSRSGSIFSASAQITTRVGHGWQLSTSMISGSYGQGGSSNTTTSSWKAGCGPGGGGGYNKLSLEIIHGNSYTIVVGSGGAGRGDRTSAKNGSSGAVGIWKE